MRFCCLALFRRALPVFPRAALAKSVLGGALAIGLVQQPRLSASENTSSNSALGALLGQAINGHVGVPGCEALSSAEGVLYMAPAVGEPDRTDWPRVLAKSVVYSFTAWNPMGQVAPKAGASSHAATEPFFWCPVDANRTTPHCV